MKTNLCSKKITLWILALRPFAFSASGLTILLAYVVAIGGGKPESALLLPLFLGVFSLHAACNLTNDYFDFISGVDQPTNGELKRPLVEGALSAKCYPPVIGSLFFVALGCGLYFYFLRGPLILLFTLLALLAAYAYTGKPFYLKYRALGEVTVFIFMGMLLPGAVFYVLTGLLPQKELLLFLAPALLIVAILLANNIRDLASDTAAQIKTLPILLGKKSALNLYLILVIAAYPLALFSCWLVSDHLILSNLLPFLSLPLAWQNIKPLFVGEENSTTLAFIDIKTAQLHALFTFLVVLSLLSSGSLLNE